MRACGVVWMGYVAPTATGDGLDERGEEDVDGSEVCWSGRQVRSLQAKDRRRENLALVLFGLWCGSSFTLLKSAQAGESGRMALPSSALTDVNVSEPAGLSVCW